jgi:hypothetical protein
MPAGRRQGGLGREIDRLAEIVRERGVKRRSELERAAGSRYWAVGRFDAALRAAVREGRLRRARHGGYDVADGSDYGRRGSPSEGRGWRAHPGR